METQFEIKGRIAGAVVVATTVGGEMNFEALSAAREFLAKGDRQSRSALTDLYPRGATISIIVYIGLLRDEFEFNPNSIARMGYEPPVMVRHLELVIPARGAQKYARQLSSKGYWRPDEERPIPLSYHKSYGNFEAVVLEVERGPRGRWTPLPVVVDFGVIFGGFFDLSPKKSK